MRLRYRSSAKYEVETRVDEIREGVGVVGKKQKCGGTIVPGQGMVIAGLAPSEGTGREVRAEVGPLKREEPQGGLQLVCGAKDFCEIE